MRLLKQKIVVLVMLICLLLSVAQVSAAQPVRYVDDITADYDLTKDIVYSEAEGYDGTMQSLKLDLYEPKEDNAVNRPVFIWMHGGNYMFGTKEDGAPNPIAAELAKKGFVGISIEYRLNPKAFDSSDSFNTTARNAAADCAAAVQWVRENGEDYGMDPTKIIIAGYSSGAEIVDNLYYNEFVPDMDRSGIAAVISVSGNRLFWPASEEEETTFGDPNTKCLIIHGAIDTVNPVSDIEKYAKQLGDRAVVKMMEGYDHYWRDDKAWPLIISTITDFLKENVTFSEIIQTSTPDSATAAASDTTDTSIAKTGEISLIRGIPDACLYLLLAVGAALTAITAGAARNRKRK